MLYYTLNESAGGKEIDADEWATIHARQLLTPVEVRLLQAYKGDQPHLCLLWAQREVAAAIDVAATRRAPRKDAHLMQQCVPRHARVRPQGCLLAHLSQLPCAPHPSCAYRHPLIALRCCAQLPRARGEVSSQVRHDHQPARPPRPLPYARTQRKLEPWTMQADEGLDVSLELPQRSASTHPPRAACVRV